MWTEKDKKDKLTDPVDEGGFGFPRKTADDYLNILSIDEEVRDEYVLSDSGDNDVARHESELTLEQARKVGRELTDFSGEEQELLQLLPRDFLFLV